MSTHITDELVQAAAQAITDYCGADWPAQAYEGEARAALDEVSPALFAQALEDAADELARLPYAKPDAPERAEYERLLAVRRGDTDKWLRARAAAVRGEV
jgi:leucyl aminopeptidase (aminopeptidase T)